MSASYPTKVLLAFRSGGVCAFCGKQLTVDGDQAKPAILGTAAHIAGEQPDAARYDGAMTEDERNQYSNLIYLCGDHHTQIDKQAEDFPVDCLLQTKNQHEARVRQAMRDAFADVSFPELEEATAWAMQAGDLHSSSDFQLVAPDDKIKKNALTNTSRVTITMGLSVSREVEVGKYIEAVAQTDPDFPGRLTAGFLQEYHRLRGKGHRGDDLFDLMCSFAQQGFTKQGERSAGLAVLIHLFELCEVFEK
jgi:hypothetical protein